MDSRPPSKLPILVFALLFAISSAITLAWLLLNHAPPSWDDAIYLSGSLRMYDALTHHGIVGYIRQFDSIFSFRAPLITALPTPFYLIFGRRWHAAFFVNFLAMLALFVAVYRIGRRWWGSRTALMAVAITATMPLMYGLARWFMVDYVLAAAVAVAIWVLVESEGLERRGFTFFFGIVCGFGLLLKFSFAAFLALPFLLVWIRSRNRLMGLLVAAAPCSAIAMPWYLTHLIRVLANALSAGFGESAVLQGTGPIFALQTMAKYLLQIAKNGTSDYYAAAGILAAIGVASTRKGREFLSDLLRKDSALTFAWMSSFLLFLFGGNKDLRYIAPILPAFALLLAASIDLLLPRNRAGAGISGLMFAVPLLHMQSVSFLVPIRAPELGYALHFDHAAWPLDEILTDISANTNVKPGERPILLIGTDRIGFNADNIELAVVARELPFRVDAVAHRKNLNVLNEKVALASFFLYKEGGEEESPVINPHFNDVVSIVRGSKEFTEIGAGRRLPDGGIARIFKKTGGPSRLASKAFFPARLEVPEEFAVDLGGVFELTGLSITRSVDGVSVKYRWRSRGSADVDYWCFTHIVDSRGKIVAQLDHPLLDGEPPARSWKPGSSALEEMLLRLPEASLVNTRLKVGLYDPASGKRLRIARLEGRAASRFSVADDGTALVSSDSLR